MYLSREGARSATKRELPTRFTTWWHIATANYKKKQWITLLNKGLRYILYLIRNMHIILIKVMKCMDVLGKNKNFETTA